MSGETFPRPPFKWDEERRFHLRCELDALFAHLYDLTRDEFAYILDAFPIVRRRDEEQYDYYRTKQTILESFDKLTDASILDGICPQLNERVSILNYHDNQQSMVEKSQSVHEEAPNRPALVQEKSGRDKSYKQVGVQDVANRPTMPKQVEKPDSTQQSMFSETSDFQVGSTDYGLYKCQACGKMVMGYSRQEHIKVEHQGRNTEYVKLR